MFNLIQAVTSEHLDQTRELFIEYASSLDFDLAFQDFEQEMLDLPGEYSAPKGRLFLALDTDDDRQIYGCIALRKLNEDICEMKRMYVRPPFRGKGIGK